MKIRKSFPFQKQAQMPCKECRISQKECHDWQVGSVYNKHSHTYRENKKQSRNLNRKHREDMVKEQVNAVVLNNERDQANVAKTSRGQSGCEVAD